MVDSVVVVLMCLSMVKSCMVSMIFVSWKLMLFEGMVVGFEKQNYLL